MTSRVKHNADVGDLPRVPGSAVEQRGKLVRQAARGSLKRLRVPARTLYDELKLV